LNDRKNESETVRDQRFSNRRRAKNCKMRAGAGNNLREAAGSEKNVNRRGDPEDRGEIPFP